MNTEIQPEPCPACGRKPFADSKSAGHGRRFYTIYCDTEGCEFTRIGLGMMYETAIKSWNQIVKWTKEKYQP